MAISSMKHSHSQMATRLETEKDFRMPTEIRWQIPMETQKGSSMVIRMPKDSMTEMQMDFQMETLTDLVRAKQMDFSKDSLMLILLTLLLPNFPRLVRWLHTFLQIPNLHRLYPPQ